MELIVETKNGIANIHFVENGNPSSFVMSTPELKNILTEWYRCQEVVVVGQMTSNKEMICADYKQKGLFSFAYAHIDFPKNITEEQTKRLMEFVVLYNDTFSNREEMNKFLNKLINHKN